MKNFITNIFNAVYNNLISGGAYYLIAKGVLVTLVMTVMGWMFAAVIGIAVSYLMCYEKKVVSVIGRIFCFIFRSIPALLLVWLFYYCIFGSGNFSGMFSAGIAIGFWGAGYLAEILARAVKAEQKKLSETTKLHLERVYYTTVIPQAIEDSIHELKRLCVHILQWTCVAGYISVNDLTQVMYGIGQRTMYPFFSIFFTAIMYIVATLLIEWVFGIIEKKIK